MTVLFTALVVMAVFYWVIRSRETVRSHRRSSPHDIDHDVLEDAEREVRDLGIDHHPDDGFEGDDWGPGAAK